MRKKAALLLLLVLLTGLLGGCWSRKEIRDVAIVLGAGVDWTDGGRIRLTVQIARPDAFAAGEGGGGGKEAASWVVSAEGQTVEDAERYLAMKVSRYIYWGHCAILVIGEEMAKKGTGMFTNFFQRDREPRETMWLMVTKGEAKDILETHSELVKTSAQAASLLNKMQTGYPVQIREYAEMLAGKGVQPVITRIEVKEAGVVPEAGQEEKSPVDKQVEISGVGVFKGDKLIGWLDAYETRGLLWLKGEAVKGVIDVPSPGKPDKEVSIKIRRGSTKVTPVYDGETLRFDVLIRVEGDMVDQQSREDLAKPGKIKALEGAMAEKITKRAAGALEKAQNEYGVDIFGFGDAFHRKYKKDWRQLKDRWDEEFVRAEVNVAVDARINEIGLLTERVDAPEK